MKYYKVQVQEELPFDVNNVWLLLRDFGNIKAWATGNVVKIEGSGVGMIRHIAFDLDKVVERCEAHDDDNMTFTYRLLESPWPMSNYVATVILTSAGPGKTLIEWSSNYQAEPEKAEAVRNLIESTYRIGFIARLRKTLSK
ncbi:MAG: SRPBCC family protein [Colwellia sp.]|nr:SRPBCC family protein [Colwellia sp.]